MPNGDGPTHLTVHVKGVVLPAWFAALVGIVAILSTVALILSLMVNKELSREIRVLQIHTRDIETVMIREGLGVERDFPPWNAQPPREPATLVPVPTNKPRRQ